MLIKLKGKTLRQPLSARSSSLRSARSTRAPTPILSTHHDPHLKCTQELKYLGNQFIVGKTDPKLQSTHELRFQRLYSARLRKLHIDKSKEQRDGRVDGREGEALAARGVRVA